MTSSETVPLDVIDQAVPLAAGDALYALRRQRPKIVDATQGSYAGMFAPTVAGVSVVERLLIALHACHLSGAATLAAHYRARLQAEGADAALVAAAEGGAGASDARVATLLAFTAKLIVRPIEGDRSAVQSLADAGLAPAAIVAVGQLIAFLSYQIRVVAGLQALAAAGAGGPATPRPPEARGGSTVASPIRIRGFTNEVLDWTPWAEPVRLDEATPEQMAALHEMSPTAKDQAYFRLLAHQPEMLLQRSIAFNAIMFAPGGMPRAERELGATVESRLNGCVYCASVHAQRFEQLAKRNDVIVQLFEDPATAGTSAREKAIVQFSAKHGLAPAELGAADVQALRAAGLTDGETLDLVHAVALFAWANRLMLNLGEPIHQDGTPAEKARL
ncbi:peroxidase-related enzyme [Pseudorhodoferax sp. LjRoot39]|uniref:CMD domain-containing protein n=1 Tax=Pseudorhodoferax sp. LjRoot39 TaxID=3342328 RepID=UPI003ECD2E1D